MSAPATKRHPASGAWARALLELGRERKQEEVYGAELLALAEEILATGAPRVFFESPKVPRSEKKQALRRALEKRISEPVLNLLQMLIDRGRQMLLGQIAHAYQELLDAARGRVHVKVTAAAGISPGALAKLVSLLGKRLAKEIIAESATDERLLGGMTVQIGDTMIDGSLRARLNVVRRLLASRRFGKELIQ